MPGGEDTQQGIYYQNYVGVYRALSSFLKPKKPQYIRFESKGEKLEDINIFYDDRVIFEQVKKKANSVWIPSGLKIVLSKFMKKHKELCKYRSKYEFWFTTNADYSKKVIPLVETIEKLKQNQEINDDILYVFFDNNIDDMSLKLETLRILEIHWNFFSFSNHLNPVKRIKDKCLELLGDFENELINTPENVILSLYDRISEFSSKPSEQNNFTKTVFSHITGIKISDDEETKFIKTLLGEEIYNYLKKLEPLLFYLYDPYGNKAICYIYLKFKRFELTIGVVDDYFIKENINDLSKHMFDKGAEPIIMVKGEKIKKSHFPPNMRQNIINYDLEELKNKIDNNIR